MAQDLGGKSRLSPSRAKPVARLGAPRVDPGRWTLAEAVEVCRAVEAVCPPFGCHVALTGGTLYKDGARKDLDLLFYRIRQAPEINMDGLWAALESVGITQLRGFGWCYKAEFGGKPIDCFFPEDQDGEYVTDEDDEPAMVPFDIGEAA
jgi:hypothetical protein